MFAVGGFGFAGAAPNQGMFFMHAEADSTSAAGAEHSAQALVGQAVRRRSAQIPGATVIPFLPPAIQGLGQFGGFQLRAARPERRADRRIWRAAAQQLIGQGNQTPGLAGAVHAVHRQRSAARRDDRSRAGEEPRHVRSRDITNTMQILLGSAYVNDFDFNNRSYRVYVQADQPVPRRARRHRARYHVRTGDGRMMPLSNVVTVTRDARRRKTITHYNLFRSAEINGSAAPGFSSGQALQAMETAVERACCRRA